MTQYHNGKYARELKGDGSLTLRSDPPGAEVWLYELLEEGPILVERNERLKADEKDPWPHFLIAFASNGCGDFFAYDLRNSCLRVIYVDPGNSIDENLQDLGALKYPDFDSWYRAKLAQRPA